ncbi:MFS transporter [Thermomonospora amylolytica]|uniref:MFS transporter n=1 Tax=Thermomonospora amylolytica TaxID=1411117 RepID=UPI000E6C39AB|nr:MFS transporter [Thermomonospora amylolytica]
MTTTVEGPVGTGRKWGTLVIACLAVLVLNIDLTVLHLALPGLQRDLAPSATELLWIADAYGFALAGLLITMGCLGDRIGRRRLLLIGTFAFGAMSAVTAYAAGPQALIAARALLGAAGATIMPSTLSLIRNAFTDPRERTMAVGVWGGVGAIAVGLGPLVGGVLLDRFWWGSVFLINVPIMTLLLVAGRLVLVESRNPRPGRLDAAGVLLSMTGVVGVVYAIKEAAHGRWQADPAVAAVIGLGCLAAFVRRQTRLADPLIDVRLFRRIAFSGSVVVGMFAMFALVASSLIFAQYFQSVLEWSPLRAGLAGLPGALAAMAGGALAAPLITVLGRARVIAAGLGVAAAGFALYLNTGTAADYPALLLAMIPAGLGMGMALTVTSDTILASVPKERAGAASAISGTATELGGALGMAVLGSVLTAAYRGDLALPAGLPPAAAEAARDSLGGALAAASALPPSLAGPVVEAARQAYVHGMHVALLCGAALAAVVAVTALRALRDVPAVIEDREDA